METERPLYLRGIPGKLSQKKVREYAKKLLKERNEIKERGELIPASLSYQSIANKVGVYSGTTIRNWDLLDMSDDGIHYRARMKVKTKFSVDEEEVLVGWILYRDITMESSTTEKFKEFTFNYFGKEISPSFITKFMKKWSLSLKLVGNAKSRELTNREEVLNESVEWLESLEKFIQFSGLSMDNIITIDKTYLFTAPWHKNVRHIGPSGSCKSRKLTSDRGPAHEIWTTLRSNGKRGTFFVSTKEEKLSRLDVFPDDEGYLSYVPIMKEDKTKKNIFPGERSALAYLQYMILSNEFRRGDVLIFDGEPALSTPNVQQYLFEHGIHPFVLPSTLHQLLNPCDNSYHSLFKQRYYRLISNLNGEHIDAKEKLNLAMQCYYDISDESVVSMFNRCGLLPTIESKYIIVSRLMSEGITSLDRNQQHKKCLLAFLKWCKLNDLKEDLCPNVRSFSGLIANFD